MARQCNVLDLDTLKAVATVAGLTNSHGVAVDPVSGHAFVRDGGQDSVVMLDPATGAILQSIPVGRKPDVVLRDSFSGMILAFDGRQKRQRHRLRQGRLG